MPRAYLDEFFPVAEIDRLARPERSAYKPIYQMQKWFARRSSAVFRALLLAACLPADIPEAYRRRAREVLQDPTDLEIEEWARQAFLMAEFYHNHQDDPRTRGKVVLDPFMGGGTTLVEAVRLGMKPIGLDLNPVAWFITRTELAPLDQNSFRAAYHRLEERVAAAIRKWYVTACPSCGGAAEILYALWVKRAACTTCTQPVRLFASYVLTTRHFAVPYIKDVVCPACSKPDRQDYKLFDWELKQVSYIYRGAEFQLRAKDGSDTSDQQPVAYAHAPWGAAVRCPHCGQEVRPQYRLAHTAEEGPSGSLLPVALADGSPWCFGKSQKHGRIQGRTRTRKVPLSVLYSPFDGEVFEFRGKLPEVVYWRGHAYQPRQGPQRKGRYTCSPAGHRSELIDFMRSQPGHGTATDLLGRPLRDPLPLELFALQGYCPHCASANTRMKATRYKFYKRPDPADLALVEAAASEWEACKEHHLAGCWPRDPIPYGLNTYLNNGSIPLHGYAHWIKLFNPRQRLCLATLVAGIQAEPDGEIRAALAAGLVNLLNNYNTLTMWNWAAEKVEGIFFNHAFVPKAQPCEVNPWATRFGRGSYPKVIAQMVRGFTFRTAPFDTAPKSAVDNRAFHPVPASQTGRFARWCRELARANGKVGPADFAVGDPYLVAGRAFVWDGFAEVPLQSLADQSDYQEFLNRDRAAAVLCADASDLSSTADQSVDLVVTDPPFGGNVNYSELADFFYVWLALVLKGHYQTASGQDVFDHRESNLLPFPPTEAGIRPNAAGYVETRGPVILQTPKAEEVLENATQGKTADHYSRCLGRVFRQCRAKLKPDGLLVFTFHHAAPRAWWALLHALLEAGFRLEATYPVVGESDAVFYQLKPESISCDIIHVCRPRTEAEGTSITWDELVAQMRRAVARPHFQRMAGRDRRMLLFGKGLELYSRHYGRITFPRGFLERQDEAAAASLGDEEARGREAWAVVSAIAAMSENPV
jgi:adenine-specific DNA methylase